MPDVHGYSYVTTATIPDSSWDIAWDTLQTWKGMLPSFPGFLAVRIEARRLEAGPVRLSTTTIWETVEELEEWARTPYTAATFLHELPDPLPDIVVEAYEVLT